MKKVFWIGLAAVMVFLPMQVPAGELFPHFLQNVSVSTGGAYSPHAQEWMSVTSVSIPIHVWKLDKEGEVTAGFTGDGGLVLRDESKPLFTLGPGVFLAKGDLKLRAFATYVPGPRTPLKPEPQWVFGVGCSVLSW